MSDYLIPAICRPVQAREVRARIDGGGIVGVPVISPVSVELIMARVDGRRVEFAPIRDISDVARGKNAMHMPPEAGLDSSADQFVAAFRNCLKKKLIPPDFHSLDDEVIDFAINNALNFDIKTTKIRMYYFHPLTCRSGGSRDTGLAKLQRLYPSIAFLTPQPGGQWTDEIHIVGRLMRFFARLNQPRKDSR